MNPWKRSEVIGNATLYLGDCLEILPTLRKAARIFNYPRSAALQDGKQHATQKPVALMTWCLGHVPDAKAVLDPFMGSGTMGVACAQANRAFIGIEIHESYFEIACERIENAQRQTRLFA